MKRSDLPLIRQRCFILIKLLITKVAHRKRKLFFRWRLFPIGRYVFVFSDRVSKSKPLEIISAQASACHFLTGPGRVRYYRKRPDIRNAPLALRTEIEAVLQAGPPESCGAQIAILQKAVVAASGVIVTADGRVARETLQGTEGWSEFYPFRRHAADLIMLDIGRRVSRMKHYGGFKNFVLLRTAYDSNYGHWLIDCLPKIEQVSIHFDMSACIFLVTKDFGKMRDVYRESLDLLGVKSEQLLELDYTPFAFDTLIYPLPITSHPWTKSPAVIRYLEGLAARIPLDPRAPRRLYVSRKMARQRRLRNEHDVVQMVETSDFTIVYPETLSLSEQIRVFSAADIVIGPCGAALTNIVFSPRGVVVLALTSEWMQDDFFWDLTDLKNGRYHSLHGRSFGTEGDYNADFEIDIADFREILDDCLKNLQE